MSDTDTLTLSLAGLHPRVQRDLRQIADTAAATGRPFTLADALTLTKAAERVARLTGQAPDADSTAPMPLSLPFGAIFLQTPTLAAQAILDAAKAWQLTEHETFLHTAWILQHATQPEQLRRAASPDGFRACCTPDWLSQLTGTPDDLIRAIARLMHGIALDDAELDAAATVQKKTAPPSVSPSSSSSPATTAAPPSTGATPSPFPTSWPPAAPCSSNASSPTPPAAPTGSLPRPSKPTSTPATASSTTTHPRHPES